MGVLSGARNVDRSRGLDKVLDFSWVELGRSRYRLQ